MFPDMLPCSHFARDELLEASAAEAAWNFCAPVVDYDGLRREAAAAFADKVVEVQGLVARLQKTQRAAEQALDKLASYHVLLAARARLDPQRQVRENLRVLARSGQRELSLRTL